MRPLTSHRSKRLVAAWPASRSSSATPAPQGLGAVDRLDAQGSGHEPFVHEWEIGAGENIPAWMERRLGEADRLIGVFSEKYTEALFSKSERTAAYWDDPMGKRGFLTPVAIEAIPKWPPFVAPLKRLSLVDFDPDAARAALIGFLEPPGPPSLGRAMFFLR